MRQVEQKDWVVVTTQGDYTINVYSVCATSSNRAILDVAYKFYDLDNEIAIDSEENDDPLRTEKQIIERLKDEEWIGVKFLVFPYRRALEVKGNSVNLGAREV